MSVLDEMATELAGDMSDPYSNEAVLADLRELVEKYGRQPSQKQFRESGNGGLQSLLSKRWGGVDAACLAAGIDWRKTYPHWLTYYPET